MFLKLRIGGEGARIKNKAKQQKEQFVSRQQRAVFAMRMSEKEKGNFA